MAAIKYRGPGTWGTGEGVPLTISQVDTNFYNLNNNKLEKSNNLSELTDKSAARTHLDLAGLPAIRSGGSSNEYLKGDGSWGIPPTNSGTVTRVQGIGTVAGITLTGDVNSSGYLQLGGTLSVSLTSNVSGTLPIANGGTGATTAGGALFNIGAAASSHNHILSSSTGLGVTGILPIANGGTGLSSVGNANYFFASPNGSSGAPYFRAIVAADIPTLNQNTTGNANTATKWQTARTLTIGNTGKSVDGSAAVSWSLAEIGAATNSHSHNYLPTTGGTISGSLDVNGLFRITAQNGSEGGELWLAKPASGTSLAGSVVFDVFGDSIRIYENGGNYRGLQCNLTGCATNQSTIIHSGNVGSYAIPLSGGSITGNLSVSGTLSAGTFSPSSISTGNITARSLSCTNGNIQTNANVYVGPGVGPVFPLHVDKNTAWTGSYNGLDENGGPYGPSSGTIYISIRASSDIAGGRIFAVSDTRKKENINQIDSGLDFVKNVKPVTFTWKTTNQFDSGFIAQDLLKTKYNYLVNMIPDEVEEYVDGEIKIPAGTSCLVNYNSIVPILTKAIQEQQEIINNLKARIEALEAK